ncbi:hypothetical protein FRC09_000628 [Ceratobasidium sp. 395]|nr:hypothetical protein FRC09_000628 [Ceratobasidium sp. 395]
MFTEQNIHGTSLWYFLMVLRATMIVRLGPEAPVDSFEMSEVEYRRAVEAIEPNQVFGEADADASALHHHFVRYIVKKHESQTTLDGFKNEISYFDAHIVHFKMSGVDLGVTFDRDELGLARTGLLFGEPLLHSLDPPLPEPWLRAAKFIHLVMRKTRFVYDEGSTSHKFFRTCDDIGKLFLKAGVISSFDIWQFVPSLDQPEGYPVALVRKT